MTNPFAARRSWYCFEFPGCCQSHLCQDRPPERVGGAVQWEEGRPGVGILPNRHYQTARCCGWSHLSPTCHHKGQRNLSKTLPSPRNLVQRTPRGPEPPSPPKCREPLLADLLPPLAGGSVCNSSGVPPHTVSSVLLFCQRDFLPAPVSLSQILVGRSS